MRVIAGTFRSRILNEVESNNTRSTKDRVKEQIFNSVGPYFNGLSVLDLFSGSGSLGIEAISRGVDKCVFVDNDRLAIKVITDNILKLKIQDQSDIIQSLYGDYINNTNEEFDLIFFSVNLLWTEGGEVDRQNKVEGYACLETA